MYYNQVSPQVKYLDNQQIIGMLALFKQPRRIEIASVRGNSFKTINRWVAKQLGKERYYEFLAKMPQEVADTLSTAESRLWYPLEHLTSIYEYIVAEVGNGDKSILENLGRFLAEVDLGGILKPLVAFISVPKALLRTPYLWPRYDDSGDFRVVELDEHGRRAQLELADYGGGPLHCILIRAWLKRGCEIIGGKDVSVRETECRWENGGHSCQWEMIWH